MIEYRFTNVDERKRQIIEMLANAPHAEEELPRVDRIIIADLVIAAIEKVMITVDTHLEAACRSLSTEAAQHALVMLTLVEVSHCVWGVVHQMEQHVLEGMVRTAPQAGIDLQSMLEGLLEDPDAPDELRALVKAMMKKQGL